MNAHTINSVSKLSIDAATWNHEFLIVCWFPRLFSVGDKKMVAFLIVVNLFVQEYFFYKFLSILVVFSALSLQALYNDLILFSSTGVELFVPWEFPLPVTTGLSYAFEKSNWSLRNKTNHGTFSILLRAKNSQILLLSLVADPGFLRLVCQSQGRMSPYYYGYFSRKPLEVK